MSTFDLTVLNGVTFAPEHVSGIGQSTIDQSASSSTNGLEIEFTSPINRGTLVGFTVSNVTNAYVAGNGSTFPTFGSFTLTPTDGGAARTWYVHGFSGDALWVSTDPTFTLNELFGGFSSAMLLSNSSLLPSVQGSMAYQAIMDNWSNDPSLRDYYVAYGYGNGYTITYQDAAGNNHTANLKDTDGDQVFDEINGRPGNPSPPTFPIVLTSDASTYVAPPCFAAGTLLRTERGEVAVEALEVGDQVVTASGESRPVIWIGMRKVACDRHPRRHEVDPIRVKAHAFGPGAPKRDLLLSPGHAVLIDGVLVPVGLLANGATIAQEPVVSVHYYHVELDAHDVLMAEGVACESYLDDGNRQVFGNAPEHVALHGRLDPAAWETACAPVLREGPLLATLRRRLAERAVELGWRPCGEPQLSLMADGVEIAPFHAVGDRVWFMAPKAKGVVLRSPSSKPVETVEGSADHRRLGVAVQGLRVDGVNVPLDDAIFGAGFEAIERLDAAAWRWTNGAAQLRLPGSALIELSLRLTAPTWKRPAEPRLRLVEAG
ncbi:Hint domain-containing protein [Caulobacter sp. CCNWLY153]|uniref:Hint domain-containing protein n=1 Tax=unclassified Caulobacter TaxID=2648921 RepID=UPI002FF2FEFB